MPARTVVLDRLSKFTGEGHELLLPGEFTQLTGRAGRRGIDTVGHGVVLHSPFVPFERIASIARLGSHPLRSSFRPTHNMVVNLVANYSRRQAEQLLAASFAEFQDRRRSNRRSGGKRPDRSRLMERFDRTRRLLEELGYIRKWSLEPRGEALRVVYSDLDLLLVEAIRTGLFTGLGVAELAALVSAFAYEPRRDAEEPDGWPTGSLDNAWRRLVDLAGDLAATAHHHGLPETRFPHPGFAWLAYAWARQADLHDLLDDHALDPGDFVRTTRSLHDLLRQVGEAARVLGDDDLGGTAARARRAIDRGVIAAGGVT